MQTTNIVDENIKRIGELFPNCLTERLNDEGKPEVAIDFDQLRQELSKDIVEGVEERYQFTWPDKRNAIRLANAPTTDTLRPCRKESVDFDNTQNLYIEGDNLEVLKLLRENYLGKVKMIYIDPPYNTGNDFVYNDDFTQSADEYVHNSGQEDEEGNRLVANTESNGRFHTDWLNMIYPRLKVAKDLLSEDGVIFISIDDNEVENLKKLCNEVFGEHNFLANIIWQHSIQPKGYLDTFSVHHNHILFYKRNTYKLVPQARKEEDNKAYSNPDNDPNGPWRSGDVRNALYRPNLIYDIISPSGKIIKPCDNGWRWSKETVEEKIKTGEIIFSSDETRIIRKIYLKNLDGRAPETIWFGKEVGTTRDGVGELKDLFGKTPFDTPKPVKLIKKILSFCDDKDCTILDFFSGSATTAHAVMQLNAEDGGNRKFIMVQLPEPTDEKSEAYKAGYKNICEIGKERIRRAGKKIKDELESRVYNLESSIKRLMNAQPDNSVQLLLLDQQKEIVEKVYKEQILPKQKELDELRARIATLDTGFRVLKLDSSNMQDVYYTPADFDEKSLFEDNIKGERTEEDLLFQVMIEFGIELSAKIEKRSIAGKTVWSVSDGYLMACFDTQVNETAIKEISKQQPYYFVMRDASLATDNVADNFEQIWQEYSKDTIRRIL